MSILGVDISNNNGSLDIQNLKNNGVQYVYMKATEGQTFKDSYMHGFYNTCKELGMKVGPYHFLVSSSAPEAQAKNFLSKISGYDWDMVPMLDVESMRGFDEETICEYVKRFISTFEQLSPMKLGIYTYTSFIDNLVRAKDIIKDRKFWEANYNNNPWSLNDTWFTNRIGHQYTEHGNLGSFKGDVNEFTEGVLIESSITLDGSWKITDTGWWYEHSDGSYTKKGWEFINNKWYYFNEEGYMVSDWKKDGDHWYFLGNEEDGSMKTGWNNIDSKWYYFDESGSMQTGWTKVDGEWFYLDKSGVMQTGWIKIDGNDYLLYSNGQMARDCTIYGYNFDNSGAATKA